MSVLEGAEVKRADQVTLARGSAAASVPSSAPAAHPPREGALNLTTTGQDAPLTRQIASWPRGGHSK